MKHVFHDGRADLPGLAGGDAPGARVDGVASLNPRRPGRERSPRPGSGDGAAWPRGWLAAALGLSPVHISPLPGEKTDQETREAVAKHSAKMQKEMRERLSPRGDADRAAYMVGEFTVAKGGRQVRLKGQGGAMAIPENQGTRKAIKGFSTASARRLAEKLNSIDQRQVKVLPVFVTLTYPAQFSADPPDWKRDLDVFVKRLMRSFDVYAVVWKLEPQQRGAPHFHLMVFRNGRIDRAWVSQAWFEIVGSGRPEHLRAGTRVETLRSWNGVVSYASKRYMGKTFEGVPDWWTNPGRFWGVRGKLPISRESWQVDGREFCRMRRVLRRYLSRQVRRKVRTFGERGLSVRLNSRDAVRLLAWAVGDHVPCDVLEVAEGPPPAQRWSTTHEQSNIAT